MQTDGEVQEFRETLRQIAREAREGLRDTIPKLEAMATVMSNGSDAPLTSGSLLDAIFSLTGIDEASQTEMEWSCRISEEAARDLRLIEDRFRLDPPPPRLRHLPPGELLEAAFRLRRLEVGFHEFVAASQRRQAGTSDS